MQTLLVCLSLQIFASVLASEFSIGFDNKYVTEGRDNLTDGGIYWLSATKDLSESYSVNVSVGDAASIDYQELLLTLEYANNAKNIDYYLAYTYIDFIVDDENDHELTAGVSTLVLTSLRPSIDYVYSQETNGSFIEFTLSNEIDINPRSNLSLYLGVAYDYGYASDLYDGYSHSMVGSALSYWVDDKLSLQGTVEYNIAGNDIKRTDDNKNQLWCGFRFIYRW
ncbi:hypothetical protein [Agaribacter marinus]|uniref:Uncharacterized protein n=1 Tax=Agaribacter marinus TaxID=1431249 RepID=A0AA37WML3_9ALTE|nr:hypothetical protein [Agaribacter marinus]GLR72905.1 hypothetical protein GCM10007852_38130 [Agaribacter marinus]